MPLVEQVESAVEEYMRLPYRMEVYWDDGYWAAEFPELPGLAAGHEDRNELWSAVDDAKRAYFEAALRSGRTIPRPRGPQDEYSGNLRLRLAKSIHRHAAEAAGLEGVSLNQFISNAVARELGRRDLTTTQSVGDWIELNPGWIRNNALGSWPQLRSHFYATVGLSATLSRASVWISGTRAQGSRLETTMRYVNARGALTGGHVLGTETMAEKVVTRLAV